MSKRLSELTPDLDINKHVVSNGILPIAKKIVSIDTPDIWGVADLIIREFEKYYKQQMKNIWLPYMTKRREGTDRHALAQEGDLRESGFRLSLTFPIFYDVSFDRDDSLQQKLEQHCPDVFKDPKCLYTFQKKYPEFVVAKSI